MKLFNKILVSFFLVFAGALSSWASTEKVSVRFRFGKSEADISKLEQVLGSADASRIAKIVVRASSSPDGPYAVNKDLARKRGEFISDKIKELVPGLSDDAISTTVVAEDWSGVEKWLRRCGKAYKDEALKIVTQSAATEREAKLQDLWAGEAWDDMMRSAFPGLRNVHVTIVYSEPDNEAPAEAEVSAVAAVPVSDVLHIMFPAGIRYVYPEYANNAAVLAKFADVAANGKSLRIQSYASPEGAPANNVALASYRAECVRKYILENFSIPADKIVVENKGEDWIGLLHEVKQNYDGKNRDAVIGILSDDTLSAGAKKAAIRRLDAGATWSELIGKCMPALRTVVVLVK